MTPPLEPRRVYLVSVSGAMKRGKEFGTSEFRQRKRVWNLGVQTEEKSLEPQSSDRGKEFGTSEFRQRKSVWNL